MREAQTKKIPYILILGDKEKESKTISYRLHGEQETTTVSIKDFVKLLKEEIDSKKNRA